MKKNLNIVMNGETLVLDMEEYGRSQGKQSSDE